jgi:hypothetical protein
MENNGCQQRLPLQADVFSIQILRPHGRTGNPDGSSCAPWIVTHHLIAHS